MRLGLFGGTFDPIHDGHLAVASLALEKLDLDKVLFVPAADPYLRSTPVASVTHRCEMVRIAIASQPNFSISMVDATRAGHTYTWDTLTDLKSRISSAPRPCATKASSRRIKSRFASTLLRRLVSALTFMKDDSLQLSSLSVLMSK